MLSFFIFAQKIYTLDSYLEEIKKNPLIESYEKSASKSKNLPREASLITSPKLELELKKISNLEKNPFKKEQDILKSKLSLKYASPIGLNAELSYEPGQVDTVHENPLAPLNLHQYTNDLKIGLSTSLTRNLAGSQIRLQKKKIHSYQTLNSLRNNLSYKNLLQEAEETYIKLFVSQEKLKIIQENLEKAEKLYSKYYNRRKVNLIDQSDLIQTEALKERYEVEKQLEEQNYKNLLRDYFYFLQQEPTSITLNSLVWETYFQENYSYQKNNLIKQLKKEELNLLKTDLKLKKKELYPDLNLTGGLQWTSYHKDLSSALNLKDAQKSYFIQVQLSFPLLQRDVFLLQDSLTHELYKTEKEILDHEKKDFKNFTNLLEVYRNSLKTFKNINRIKEINKKRLSLEKEKLSFGTSTSFQVYMIEQEYYQSQIKELEMIEKNSQLKMTLRNYQ